jgi:4-amino-4-deoxy-L-arabinose transferase-like glycosyltransferase
MSRLTALAIFVALWAAIYLPGLGSTEIKGEEGRRILPAVTMLETGNWLVPYLGGKPYLRKPPLMNWAIAASFKITGIRNEWTARLPSALAVLVMGATMVGVAGSGWMKPVTALIAAIAAMTFFGVLAKARFAGAEIEGVYGPLFGIAITLWLAWWRRNASPWLTWTVPFVFLGLGLLTKAPLHLLFFYAIVGTALWRAKSLKSMLYPAHALGVGLMIGMFAAWAGPYFQSEAANKASKVWQDQIANRVVENKSSWSDYAMNLPRGVGDLLPWVVLAPVIATMMRRPKAAPGETVDGESDESLRAAAASTLAVSAVLFVGMLLIPGVLPRYVLPLTAPMALGAAVFIGEIGERYRVSWHRANQVFAGLIVLVALVAPIVAALIIEIDGRKWQVVGYDWKVALPAVGASTIAFLLAGFLWSRRAVLLTPAYLAISTASAFGAGSLLYGAAAPKHIALKDDLRPLAVRINKSVPAGAELVILDPGYQPAFFYLTCRHRYAADTRDIPAGAEFVLARLKDIEKVKKKRPEYIATFDYKRKGELEYVLLQPLAEGAGK